jgi:hypothetical protein
MSEITRGVMGMPYEMVMSSEISRRQFYSIAREVYAESERLSSGLNQANHMLADAEAENESLRADAERYRWLRKTEDWEEAAYSSRCEAAFVSSGTGMGNMFGVELDNAIDLLVNSSPENP